MGRAKRVALPASIKWDRRPRAKAMAGWLFLIVGLLIAGLDRCTYTPRGLETDLAIYHGGIFRVVNVIDGDTFDIDVPDDQYRHTRIRLWGVDTPETAERVGEGMHYGPEASAFAKKTLLGKHVRIELSPLQTRGKYGRLLVYVYSTSTDTMFNERLILLGLGYADLRFDHVYKPQFKALEKRARHSGAGLWKNVTLADMPEWRQRYERFCVRTKAPVEESVSTNSHTP